MSWFHKLRFSLILCLLMLASGKEAEAQIDTTELKGAVTTATINTSGLGEKLGGVVIDPSLAKTLPRLLGSSDPLRFVQYLPWVQTTSEQDAGIRINGCETSHNYINIDGIPVYGAQHLLGLFSSFIPTHFDKINIFSKSAGENRIGGEITMLSKNKIPERFEADLNVGLIEAEATLAIPLGEKNAIYASARKSFLNLLYGNFLKIDDEPVKYSMVDANLGFVSRPGSKDLIQADFYFGSDAALCKVEDYGMNLDFDWGNILGGLKWTHSFQEFKLENSVYASNYSNRFDLNLQSTQFNLPSSILDLGYKVRLFSENGLSVGLDYSHSAITPQGGGKMDSNLASLWMCQKHDFLYWLSMTATLKGEYFKSNEGGNFWNVSPSIDFLFMMPLGGKIILSGGMNHQYLFQTGLSNINLPIEFWLPAGKYSAPQQAIEASLKYNRDFFSGKYSLSVEGYYKKLDNQLEYKGQLIDLARIDWRLDNCLLKGYGYNCGASILVHKNSGKLTGWLSYTWSRSRRHFDESDYPLEYSSSHERPHEFKALAMYKLRRWDFSGTFVIASGTPFTPIKSFYVIGEHLVFNYDKFNSARLPAYLRLDLSANYYFSDKKINGINLSLYNVTCRKNAITYRLCYDSEYLKIYYHPICFNLLCLPSVSYFHKF